METDRSQAQARVTAAQKLASAPIEGGDAVLLAAEGTIIIDHVASTSPPVIRATGLAALARALRRGASTALTELNL